MDRIPSMFKNCATCVFWVGPRDVDTFATNVIVESRQTEGKCMCRQGWYRQQRKATDNCSSYEKWKVLG